MLTGIPCSMNQSSRISVMIFMSAFFGIGAAIGHPEYRSMLIK
jgi:hypothetical protein